MLSILVNNDKNAVESLGCLLHAAVAMLRFQPHSGRGGHEARIV